MQSAGRESILYQPDHTTGTLLLPLTIMFFPSTFILASSQHLTQKKSSVATSESTVQRTGKSSFGKAEWRWTKSFMFGTENVLIWMHIQSPLTHWVYWGLGRVFYYYLCFWDCFSLLVTLCFGSFQSLVGNSGWSQVKKEKSPREVLDIPW